MRTLRDPLNLRLLTLRLWRSNAHIEPSIGADVRDIVQIGVLAFLLYLIVIVVLL